MSGDVRRARVLIAGVSTRAAADSAAHAGYDVVALDAFGDIDHHPSVRALSVPRETGRRFSPAAGARVALSMPGDAAMYASGFENDPRAVAQLALGRALWGNAPDVLRRVRDPLALHQSLRCHGFLSPDVRTMAPASASTSRRAPGRAPGWLVKPLASAGGHRVRPWSGGLPARCYLQSFIAGTPGSVVFVAAGGGAVPLGVTTQLVGDHAFGASGYRYCGSLLRDPHAGGDAAAHLVRRATEVARHVAQAFGLVGVNGIDFIAQGGEPAVIEVNPRWSASMELVERAYGLSVFGAHAAACHSGALPAFQFEAAVRCAPVMGKAIVFARYAVTVGDTRRWLGDDSVRDVPPPGERVRAGQPVCTVFASGATEGDCYRALVAGARRVYRRLEAWASAAA